MPKIQRETQKIFCNSAESDQLAVFGSMATGTPVYSNNIEDLQNNEAFDLGWDAATLEDKAPFMEEMNGMQYGITKQLAYNFQEGIPEYDAGTTYYIGSICKVLEEEKPVLYTSLTDENLGNNPVTDATNWERLSFGGGGLEIGDIGIAPLGIDETKGKRRYLNGQLIIQDQYIQFTNKVKSAVALYPSLACTESEWQTAITMSAFGACGKFVIDDEAGTIRLPKITGFIQGLTDLRQLANLVQAGLPTHTHTRGTMEIAGTFGDIVQSTGSGASGAFNWYSTNSQTNANAGTLQSLYNVDFYASRSWTGSTSTGNYSKSLATTNTVQPEAIQYPYFIQVATGAETEDNIINEIELNNPYSFGDSKYSPVALNNLSWLKSEGQWNSKAVYPAYYDWILTNVNNGVEGFIGNTMYMWGSASGGYMCQTLTPKVGSPIWGYDSKAKVGYVTKVYDTGELDFIDNSNNVSYIKIGRYSPSDESSNAYITDYDFVLNTADETFRLPLLNGSEDLPSDKFDNLTLLASGSTYTAPANGWFVQNGASTGTNQRNVFVKNGILQGVYSSSVSQTLNACVETLKGESIIFLYNITPSIFRFIYAQGNGSLYFYVGETVQNANLINAGRIEETLATKVNMQQATIASMPSNRYIDLTLGASGTQYTAPANGWYFLRKDVQQGTYMEMVSSTGLSTYDNSDFLRNFRHILPVRKNDVLTVNYNSSGTTQAFRFYYAEGDK